MPDRERPAGIPGHGIFTANWNEWEPFYNTLSNRMICRLSGSETEMLTKSFSGMNTDTVVWSVAG